MVSFSRFTTLIILLSIFSSKVSADSPQTPLYIIFDGSNSMWGELPDKSRKIEIAKKVFNDFDQSIFEQRKVALRIYGHRRSKDCDDTELVSPFASGKEQAEKMAQQVNKVSPRGKTPITRSLKAALQDIGDQPADILLISDGIETCDADPCDLVRAWRNDNINVRVHVVGLGLDDISRSAMQCISDAAGTQYLDAKSAKELTEAIQTAATSEPPAPGKPDPKPQQDSKEFIIKATDSDGNFLPVLATIQKPGMEPAEVKSNHRYVFDEGEYTIVAGVPTVNGEIYSPIEKNISVLPTGTTVIEVVLDRPPQVRTRFLENDIEIRGVLATAYQSDESQFNLRPGEDYFILPGEYRFQAELNQDNKLAVTETIVEGDDKFIDFIAIKTVDVYIRTIAEGTDTVLRQHQKLFQNGEEKYKLHFANGGAVQPGTYTLVSEHPLTSYEIENFVISNEEKQTIELSVPMATAKLTYQFIDTPDTNDMRCWLSRLDQDNNTIASSKAKQCDGSELLLGAGRYRVDIWSRLGEFSETIFDINTGESKDIIIQQTKTP